MVFTTKQGGLNVFPKNFSEFLPVLLGVGPKQVDGRLVGLGVHVSVTLVLGHE
jgi:hypothetical protein